MKSFYGVLTVRTVAAEYLVAMKLRSGRKYKNDLSDVIGILAEHEKRGASITLENGDFENIYFSVKSGEIESKDILVGFEKDYPKVTNESNVNDILKILKAKRNRD